MQTCPTSPTGDIVEFRRAYGLPVGSMETKESLELHLKLIKEEYQELMVEVLRYHRDFGVPFLKEALAKEAVDLVYVLVGLLTHLGVSFDLAWAAVHKSNMSKLEDGKPVLRSDGKILKGRHYQPADLKEALQ